MIAQPNETRFTETGKRTANEFLTGPRVPAVDLDWIRGLPKVELHTHLESVNPVLMEKLARRAGRNGAPALASNDSLDDLLGYLDEVGSLFTTVEDLSEMAFQLSERAARSGAHYIEVIFNVTHWRSNWGHRWEEFYNGLDQGFTMAERAGHARARLAVSVMRTQTVDAAKALVEYLALRRPPRVVALSVDGNETSAGLTGEKLGPAFRLAREKGLRRTVHTGESGDASHIWDSLKHLEIERIDHGFRCVTDASLVEHLRLSRIPLTICPSFNVVLGWVPSIESHPLEFLRKSGVRITLNTDISWGFVLADEYKLCADTFGWDKAILRQLAANSIEASFASEDEKRVLLSSLAAYPD